MTTMLRQYGLRDVGDAEVGIEIEVEGQSLPYNEDIPRSWSAHHDGSLRGESMEYVLRRPITRDKVETELDKLMKKMEECLSTINDSDNCGVHIHINCQQMNTKEVLKFACLYLVMEEILVSMCGKNRAGNLFCLRSTDAEGLVFQLCEAKRTMNLNGLQNDRYRYSSMNMASLSKFGTLEFRAMRTPKDFRDLKEWADILLNIKDASQKFEEIRDIVENVSRLGSLRFLEMVFEEGGRDIYKEVDDCDSKLMRGVRLVQEIAYTRTIDEVQHNFVHEGIPMNFGLAEIVDAARREQQRVRLDNARQFGDMWQDRIEELALPEIEEDMDDDIEEFDEEEDW